jgi:hypothetical protein
VGKRAWTEEKLREVVPKATSWRQVMIGLGLAPGGGQGYTKVQTEAVRLGLDVSHFTGQGWNLSNGGNGRDPEKQRAANRRWYDENRQVYAERNDRRRRERVEMVRKLKNRPCADCGLSYPYFVMDFDHREGVEKLFNIGNGIRRMVGTKRLLAEIEKCDLVCANCHRHRTARRAGWDGSSDPSVLAALAEDT